MFTKELEDEENLTVPYEIVTSENIANKITDGKMNLDYCYLNNLKYCDIAEYLKDINEISAVGTFFDGILDFTGAEFNKIKIDFNGAQFSDEEVSFRKMRFTEGELDFTKAKFGKGNVSFNMADFGNSKVLFEETDFGKGDLTFEKSEAENAYIIFRKCKLLGHENLRFKSVHKLEIIDCIIDGTLSINSKDEYDVRIDKLSLADTKNIGAIFINGDVAIQAVSHYDHCSYISKANQMKMLKENFHNIGEYDWEDKSYVEYKRYIRKSMQDEMQDVHVAKEKVEFCGKIILDYLVDWIGVYATSPTRVAQCMFMVWLIFGMAFGMGTYIDCLELNTSSTMQFIQGFYFSAITFLTIGYGDISPLGWLAEVLAPTEGFLGLFLMSYFTVAVIRKTLR